ncbi:hypothetical protein KIN20_000788 [Parelaphostrongylus tenuis]|uniref:Uncharacterized protein n=1 Tax=Parelaphostrongylus tenuis TaxID=148309 RepID=A0AAD5LSP8_PARTN|nr:hypothetical protein KIN20_000788 [Parelaphostrongylus tenuis]
MVNLVLTRTSTPPTLPSHFQTNSSSLVSQTALKMGAKRNIRLGPHKLLTENGFTFIVQEGEETDDEDEVENNDESSRLA